MWNQFHFTYAHFSGLSSKRTTFINCSHIIELPENASHVGQFGLQLSDKGADHVSCERFFSALSFLKKKNRVSA